MSTSPNASPRLPRPTAPSDDMEYEDKHMFPPSRHSHLGSPIFSRRSVHSVHSTSSSVENSPAAPSGAKSYTNSPLKTRHSESELLVSPRNRSELDEYPRYDSKKRMSADFSDDTMSVGSIGGGESPKSDKGNWRIRSAVAGPFLTGPLAKDFQSEHLKTPRGKASNDMNFDHSGLMFPLAPVLDAIPDTPRGGYHHQPQGFTDISQYENSSQPMDGFNLDHSGYATNEPARPTATFNSARRVTNSQSHEAMLNSQYYAGYGAQDAVQGGLGSSQQQHAGDHHYNGASQSSAIVATQSSSSHASSYADVVGRNGGGSSEQSLVSSSGNDSLESLSKGMADSMAQILAKTQNGRSFGEVQLTTLVQKIHLHMNIMGRTSAAIREDYNRIKAKLEQTITDKKVLEATNYHLQQLVQQYEVERQYFHQYVLHSLQSQSSLIYESMGNLSQNVAQSKYTIEELSARLSRELSSIQGSRGNDSQLKEVLEEIKRAVDISSIAGAHQGDARSQSPAITPQSASKASTDTKSGENKPSGFKLTPVLLAVLLWIATLGGVYFSAKSAALSELQQQPSASILPSDLDLIVDQISQKLESAVQASEVRKLVYTELKQNPQIVESVAGSAGNGIAEEISQRLKEEVKVELDSPHKAPEATASSEPSVSVSEQGTAVIDEQRTVDSTETEVAPDAELQTDSVKEEATAKSEEPVAPAGIDASVPTDVVPPAVNTVGESESSVVEVEVPPADFPAYPDSLIAELLHLNPTDAKPSDSVDERISQPVVDAVDNSGADVATNESVEAKTDDLTEPSSDSQTLGEPTTQSVEVKADLEPVAEADSIGHIETREDVIEIAIENAVNPDLILQKEQLVHDNTSSSIAPESTEQGIIADPLEPPTVVEKDAPEAKDVNAVAALLVDVEADDSAATAETEVTIEPVAALLDASRVASPVGDENVKDGVFLSDDGTAVPGELAVAEIEAASENDEEVKTEQNEEDETALLSETSGVLSKIEEASSAAADNQELEESEETISSNGEVQAQSGDASVSAVPEDVGAATPFAGLSMALKSLANRFVEGFDASKPTEAIAGVFSSSELPEIASDTVEERELVPTETAKFADEHTERTEIGDERVEIVVEDPEVVVEVPVAAEPVAFDAEEDRQVTELLSRIEPASAVASVELAGVASEASDETVTADVGDIAEPRSDAVQVKEADELADEAEDTSGEVEKATSSIAEPRVEETGVEAKPTERASDEEQSQEVSDIAESTDDASEVKADLLISAAAAETRGEAELDGVTRELSEVDDVEVGSGKIELAHADSLAAEADQESTKISVDDAENAGSLDGDAVDVELPAFEVVGAKAPDSTGQPTVVSEPMSELSEDSSLLSAESPAEEIVEQVVITEAIDVEGNIASPVAELDLNLLSEQESEAATDDGIVEGEKSEEETRDLSVAGNAPEDVSSPVEAPTSEDERELSVEDAGEGATLQTDPTSSVVEVAVDDSTADFDTLVGTEQSSTVDEQAGDAINSASGTDSPVGNDAIGSVEAVDPSESVVTSATSPAATFDETDAAAVPSNEPEQIKSGSDGSDAAESTESVTATVSDSTSEDLSTPSEESKAEVQPDAAIGDDSDSLTSVEASKVISEVAEVDAATTSDQGLVLSEGEADQEVGEQSSQTEVDVAEDLLESSKIVDSTDESLREARTEEQSVLPVASESILASVASVDGDAEAV